MSCFSGNFLSLPGVKCDRFDSLSGGGTTVPADQFFLSHCHTDHMIGLDTLGLFIYQNSSGTSGFDHKLYCSRISKAFVRKKFPDIPDNAIAELIPNQPQTVAVSDSCNVYNLRVTAIQANHCPGSLMFMFERLDDEGAVRKRILYTGDFRFDNTDLCRAPLSNLQSLHNGSTPLIIDEMYLDTTFCSPTYLNFPSRKLAEEKIWEICQKWIKINGLFKETHSKPVILFHLPARYGHEKILQHIYQMSSNKWRAHVSPKKYSEYLCNSSLANCTDPDPKVAKYIHACTTNFKKKSDRLPCQPPGVSLCHIKPSAVYFTQRKLTELAAEGDDSLVSVSRGGGSYRVCYSTHSSMAELEMFVRYFSPLQITPCAIPPYSTKEELRNVLARFLQPSQQAADAIDSIPTHFSLSSHQPRAAAVHTKNTSYDPDVWFSPSPPEQSKRKLEFGDGEYQKNQAKVSRVEEEDSLSKICFLDTLDLEAYENVEDALYSSDEELEEIMADTKATSTPTKKKAANESFSLVLESSDDEDIFGLGPRRDSSVEILEASQILDNSFHAVTENDTPEIEDLLAEAEVNDMPGYVIKTMKEFKKKQDEVVVID